MCDLDRQIRSDLVIEYAEQFYNTGENDNVPLKGVDIRESIESGAQIHVTDVRITDEDGAAVIGKPIGRYITLEAMTLPYGDDAYHAAVTDVLMRKLRMLLPDIQKQKVLVAGIGNRQMISDAFGSLVAEHLFVTRHIFEKYGQDSIVVKDMGNVSVVVPGVMAHTGIETAELLRGLIREIQPDRVIAVDALAARNIRRLVTTIQLTDTGIHPGAGIGNRRYALTRETLGVPVVAIGLPTVIDAATIVADTMTSLVDVLNQNQLLQRAVKATEAFDHEEKHLLMRELMEPQMADLFVTPKDIDETMHRISHTVAEALNGLCHRL